jgi:hypothetical protein
MDFDEIFQEKGFLWECDFNHSHQQIILGGEANKIFGYHERDYWIIMPYRASKKSFG